MRQDLKILASFVEENSRILDIGCGDGSLLRYLKDNKKVSGRGIELDHNLVSKALKKGLAVIQGDADHELKHYPSNSFDYVILSQTLQTTKHPDLILKELQRITEYILVSVPNFGYFENRLYLGVKGKMPVTRTLSYQWYDTPNIHFCTIKDFLILCDQLGFSVERQIFVNDDLPLFKIINKFGPLANLFAKYGIFLLKRGKTVTSPKTNSSILNNRNISPATC